MTTESKRQRIKTFVARFSRNHDLEDDADIFAMGFVNSLFAMQLVLFLEKEFIIKIENKDLDFENFRTINAMVGLVERKVASSESV
jgi:acyl carrier protein